MEKLVFSIKQRLERDFEYRAYCDTGPILERDMGYQVGFGWFGKNSSLINPLLGSQFFISEIFLSIRLDVDQPFQHDRCGRCTKCIDACPTQSITRDRTLNAASCISYLTIENKKAIPREYREKIGPWLFGCDICQMVCPWNQRRSDIKVDPIFDAPVEVKVPLLRDVIQLTQEEFNRRYEDSPIKRAKRRGLLRNAAVAIGNSMLPDAVPILDQVLQNEEDALIREHVAWALGKIGTADAHQVLELAASQENDTNVLLEIRMGLQGLR